MRPTVSYLHPDRWIGPVPIRGRYRESSMESAFRPPQRRIGEILSDEGKIHPEGLDEALAEQKKCGRRLGEVMVYLRLLPEEDLAQALALQKGLRYVDLRSAAVDPALRHVIPEALVRKYGVLPLSMEQRQLWVAMADSTNDEAINDLRFSSGLRILPVQVSESALRMRIAQQYSEGKGEGSPALEALRQETVSSKDRGAERPSLAPVIRLNQWILGQAMSAGASDIHIEPLRDDFRVRFRIDGILREEIRLPKWIHRPLSTRVKVMARLDIAERRLPQDGAVRIEVDGREIDLRISFLPTLYGEKIVIRILDFTRSVMRLHQIGLSQAHFETVERMLQHPSGMLLVTGPTGSGKSTTLYSMIREICTPNRNIVTVEDPIEYTLADIVQTQVHPEIGLTFSHCLRAILRQDPNVILIGEIRDPETAEMACRAALTGHLVLSTLHTNDAPSALARLVDLGVPRYLVASVVTAVLAQRLVRRLCPQCRRERPDEGTGDSPTGCERCGQSGYSGRLGIFELLVMSPRLRERLMAGIPIHGVRQAAIDDGMVPLIEEGVRKVQEGMTSLEEVHRTVGTEEGIFDGSFPCPGCGLPVEEDFCFCPGCGKSIGLHCAGCDRPQRLHWRRCPYCRLERPSQIEGPPSDTPPS